MWLLKIFLLVILNYLNLLKNCKNSVEPPSTEILPAAIAFTGFIIPIRTFLNSISSVVTFKLQISFELLLTTATWFLKVMFFIFQAAQQRRERFGTQAWAVFFIQDSRNFRVKIGSSIDPYQSFDALQQASSVDLRLLAVLEGGTQSQAEARERELHRQFNSYHEGNGWFECVTVLQQYITLIQQQTDEKSQTRFNSPPMRTHPRRKRSHPQADVIEIGRASCRERV